MVGVFGGSGGSPNKTSLALRVIRSTLLGEPLSVAKVIHGGKQRQCVLLEPHGTGDTVQSSNIPVELSLSGRIKLSKKYPDAFSEFLALQVLKNSTPQARPRLRFRQTFLHLTLQQITNSCTYPPLPRFSLLLFLFRHTSVSVPRRSDAIRGTAPCALESHQQSVPVLNSAGIICLNWSQNSHRLNPTIE
jgi:hypothetical protein